MITGLAHVCLGSKDLTASEQFYCTVLGFRKKFDFLSNGRVTGFYLDSGNDVYIEVFSQETTEPGGRHPIKHLCFRVEDIASAVTALRSRGITVSDQVLGNDNSWQAWFKDPDVVDIELHQYTDTSTQLTEKDCIL
jgi:glyoxylase I family protein